jgi:signal peptidase I
MAGSENNVTPTTVSSGKHGKPTSAAEAPTTALPRQAQNERLGQLALRDTVITILLSALIFVGLHTSFLVLPLDGPSMQPGLHTNERVLVNSVIYDFSAPQRGDVVVFHPPEQPSLIYIKRVIGLPGDTITLSLEGIAVDGVDLNEPYVPVAPPGIAENPEAGTVILGPGQYYLLGDNRADSRDSRYFGPVPRANIIGEAQYVIWPGSSVSTIPTYRSVFAGVR